jgi:hypothetical protein
MGVEAEEINARKRSDTGLHACRALDTLSSSLAMRSSHIEGRGFVVCGEWIVEKG